MNEKYIKGQKIEVILEERTPLGVIVSFDEEEGLVYNTDIFEDYKLGEKHIAYIKDVREDGRIDITFRKHGYKNFIESTTDAIMQALRDNNGTLKLNDKSSPEAIKEAFGISKTQFKQAIGSLYKKKKIIITKSGIEKK